MQEQVRKNPANAKYRVFLFQLLAVLGQWERALNQLNGRRDGREHAGHGADLP
ncbi:MAG: hypothetical protein U1F68_01835 [Gammaproteobacteria bacterium]